MRQACRIAVAVAAVGLLLPLLTGCRAGASVGAGRYDLGVNVDPFRAVDVNLDRRITQEEFALYLFRAAFIDLDADQDELVQAKEWNAVEEGPDAEKMFQSMDKDEDGSLTFAEFSSPESKQVTVANLFRTLDADADGDIEPSELQKN